MTALLPPTLRAAFRAALGTRIAALAAAERDLAGGKDVTDSVRRMAHALCGSGATYGFPEVSADAAALEDAVRGELALRLGALLATLRRAATREAAVEQSVLVVEDDLAISALVQATLSAPDRRVFAVQTSAGARMVLLDHEPALVVLDLVLPDCDGRNLLAQLREDPHTAAVPIVVLSALSSAQVRTECLALGADEYIEKPFEPPVLAAVAARLLGKRHVTAAPAPVPAAPRASAADAAGAPGPILVVEDDDLIAAVIAHRLSREGLDVRRFADGAAAFEAAATMRPALVLLDVTMPGMDGFELLERLRARPGYADVPIVMLTPNGNERDIARGLALGADDYVAKPVSPVELMARIRRLLAADVVPLGSTPREGVRGTG